MLYEVITIGGAEIQVVDSQAVPEIIDAIAGGVLSVFIAGGNVQNGKSAFHFIAAMERNNFV